MTEDAAKPVTVYYDGKCPMCASLARAACGSSRGGAFAFRDMHAQTSMPFAKKAVEKEIHLVDEHGQIYRGAPAILKIASQYPRFRALIAIAQFPLVRPLLPIGYNIVAANRRFLFGPASRIFWLKAAVVVAFCIGLAMSPRLWIGPRGYPLAPVSNFLPTLTRPFDVALFAALFALAVAILVSARPQKLILAFLCVVAVFCLLDQTRWQPWVFQYGVLLTPLAGFSWNSDDITGRRRALNVHD